jgi:hypothetical protein
MEIVDLLHPEDPSFEDDYRRMATADSRAEEMIGKMMLDLLKTLREGVVGPRLVAFRPLPNEHELSLTYASSGNSTSITVAVDWKDRSPLVDGVPQMHYRLSYTPSPRNRKQNSPPVELRTRDIQTAYEFILEAIRQCKPVL